MPVGVLLKNISSYELTEWMAYYSIKGEDYTEKPKEPVKTADVLKTMFAHKLKYTKK